MSEQTVAIARSLQNIAGQLLDAHNGELYRRPPIPWSVECSANGLTIKHSGESRSKEEAITCAGMVWESFQRMISPKVDASGSVDAG